MANDDDNLDELSKAMREQWKTTHPWRQHTPESPPPEPITVVGAPGRLPDIPVTTGSNYIPGPIRPLQVAVRRRNKHRRLFPNDGESGPSTQHFVAEVLAEPAPFDNDFNKPNWTSVIEYVSKEGYMMTESEDAIWTSINVVHKRRGNWAKINKMVCIIKSFTPNGLGDAMVTLKDPTGTIDGSIHHTVFNKTNNAHSIEVGAVLILRKVTAAKFGMGEKFVNITAKNVVAVVGKNDMIPNPTDVCGGYEMESNDEDSILSNTIVPDSDEEM